MRERSSDMPPVILVEPSTCGTRRAAGIFLHKERQPDLELIKRRLREIRRFVRDHHAALRVSLKQALSRYGQVGIADVTDAQEAALYIKLLAPDLPPVSLNKSNVVMNELRPALKAAGFSTYLRYCSEFADFPQERFLEQMEDYWSLPGMHDRGLVESFEVRYAGHAVKPAALRNYLAVLGVNAIAAEDGTAFFLQHMANVSKDLEQAKKVVFVISLEKIMKNKEEALFHTRSMGIFGLESMLLDLLPKESEMLDFDGLPALPEYHNRELHAVIIDNGRGKFLTNGFADLFLCIDCRACARQCPIGRHLPEEQGFIYSPKNFLLGFLQGRLPSLDVCLHCGRCHTECPLEINIPALFWKAQSEHFAKTGRSWRKRLLDDPESLAKLGSAAAPFSTWATKMPFLKAVLKNFMGLHRQAMLPSFHRQTFRDWHRRGRHA